jgi:hypothetical protein
MITFDRCREIALSFPESIEEAHFEKTSFRIKNKIFGDGSIGCAVYEIFVD